MKISPDFPGDEDDFEQPNEIPELDPYIVSKQQVSLWGRQLNADPGSGIESDPRWRSAIFLCRIVYGCLDRIAEETAWSNDEDLDAVYACIEAANEFF